MGIMDSIDIGAKALQVHGKRIDIHAKNIANLDTPNYVRKIPVLTAVDDVSFHGLMNNMKEDVFGVGTLPYLQGGVNFSGVVEDPTLGHKIYKPGHPDADENGYVLYPNVDAVTEFVNLIDASRGYEVNATAFEASKSMAQRGLSIGQA